MTAPTENTPACDTAPCDPQARPGRIAESLARAELRPWGTRDYGQVLEMQERLRVERREDKITDTWLAGEHPTVITQGVRGEAGDLKPGDGRFPVFTIDRGGMTTLHNPGQLVIYPIIKTQGGLLAQAWMSRTLLGTVRDWLREHTGVGLVILKGRPGLFADKRKVAAIGISIRSRVSMHGIAINLCNDLSPWQAIVPCGEPSTRPITLSELAGKRIEPATLIEDLPRFLTEYWQYETVDTRPAE